MIQEILSENKNRAYPFKEDSDLGCLPNWILLDIRFVNVDYKNAEEPSVLRCTKFTSNGESATLSFSYVNGENNIEFDIPVLLGSGTTVGTINTSDSTACKFAVYGGGSEYNIDGDVECELDAQILETRVIETGLDRKVGSIGGATGEIHIQDGHNTTAKLVGNEITVTAGRGLGFGNACTDDESAFNCSNALLFVNGQHADTSGNLNIVGGAGIVVQTGRTALVDGIIMPAIVIKVSDSIKEML